MKRALMQNLVKWQQQAQHLPLLLRGARQVGKSYCVNQLGNDHFEHFVSINFELEPEYKACFETLRPTNILNQIYALSRQKVTPGKTLLFLDEIQECPEAIKALRYFKEQIPDLHVIGAGSLLEFILNDESFSFPVGRVQDIHLRPVSFLEFLSASGYEKIISILRNAVTSNDISDVIHQQLTKLLREYLILGGMPAVLSAYLSRKDLEECKNLQTTILLNYRNDFAKYAKKTNHKYLQALFAKIPGLIGQQFKYSHVNPEMRSRDLKSALELLNYAGIAKTIHATQASGLPLNALLNDRKFKVNFLDIGLVNNLTRLSMDALLKEDLLLLNRGALAEQFVGEELLAYQSCYEPGELYYWERDKKNAQAEVDYITHVDENIIPIEVKAGKTGRLKSLQIFLQEKKLNLGIRISQAPLNFKSNILSVPLYMISELPRLVKYYLNK